LSSARNEVARSAKTVASLDIDRKGSAAISPYINDKEQANFLSRAKLFKLSKIVNVLRLIKTFLIQKMIKQRLSGSESAILPISHQKRASAM
jgi:hypothetical protein